VNVHTLMHRRLIAALWLAAAAGSAGCQAPAPGADSRGAPATQARMDERNARGVRQLLFEELQPVTLENCTFTRVGSPHDGGYVMCDNLLGGFEGAYSYGIGGHDAWGCEIATRHQIPVHQYDCFEPPNVTCPGGQFVPHAECVGAARETVDSRVFDTVANHVAQNGHTGKRIVVKMDVEGAEWEALLATPDAVLERIDQLPMELHGVDDPRFIDLVQKLKRTFHLVHLHFNNWACAPGLEPFPASAYQVLFVNKRLGVVGPPQPGAAPAHAFDAPDYPDGPDCQLREETSS
jgi:hypothetical protein